MSLDGYFKLLRLVEYIVEILGIQLGPEERVPVHCFGSTNVMGGTSHPGEKLTSGC